MIEGSIEQAKSLLDSIQRRLSEIKYPEHRKAASIDDLVTTETLFLVTPGRSGTRSLVDFCRRYSDMLCAHAAQPWLASVGYKYHQKGIGSEAARYAFYAAREPWLLRAYQQRRVFLDGDCKNLPLVGEIAELLPNSRFLHVVRNPESFIKSGMKRRYYKGLPPALWGHLQAPGSEGVAVDVQIPVAEQVGKIGYFWNEANLIAEDLKLKLGPDRAVTIVAEDMFKNPGVILDALEKLGLYHCVTENRAYRIRGLNKQSGGEKLPEDVLPVIKSVVASVCTTSTLYYDS